jgi:hypothetical protein
MGIFSRNGGNHKPSNTVKGFVDEYIQRGFVGVEQLGALDADARSSADQAELDRLREAIGDGLVQVTGMGRSRRS